MYPNSSHYCSSFLSCQLKTIQMPMWIHAIDLTITLHQSILLVSYIFYGLRQCQLVLQLT